MYRDCDKKPNSTQCHAISEWINLAPREDINFVLAEEKAMMLRLAAGKVYCAIAGDPVAESDVEVQKKIFTAAKMMDMDHNSHQQQIDAARAKYENEQRVLRQAAYNTQLENMTGRLG